MKARGIVHGKGFTTGLPLTPLPFMIKSPKLRVFRVQKPNIMPLISLYASVTLVRERSKSSLPFFVTKAGFGSPVGLGKRKWKRKNKMVQPFGNIESSTFSISFFLQIRDPHTVSMYQIQLVGFLTKKVRYILAPQCVIK